MRLAAELHVYELLLVVVVLIRKSRVVGCGAANGRRSILPGRGSAMVIFYLSITIHHCQYNAGAEYCWTRKANRIRARPRARPRPAYCCSTSWFAYLGLETQPGPECRVLLLLTKSQCRTSDINDIHTPASHVLRRSTHHLHNVGVKANTSRTLGGYGIPWAQQSKQHGGKFNGTVIGSYSGTSVADLLDNTRAHCSPQRQCGSVRAQGFILLHDT